MPEEKTFDNARISSCTYTAYPGLVRWSTGEGNEIFSSDEWDMSVTFRRKQKPIPVGTLVYCKAADNKSLVIAQRLSAEWKTLTPKSLAGEWLGTLEEQDECARRAYTPLVEGEWNSVREALWPFEGEVKETMEAVENSTA